MSVGELLMTFRISLVAVCCSSASVNARSFSCRSSPVAFSRSRLSARCFSRSRTLEPSFFRNFLATGSLASTLDFVGFAPRRIGPSLLLAGPHDRAAIDDRLGEPARRGKLSGSIMACEPVPSGTLMLGRENTR